MTAFADASALVKLYVPEEGHEAVAELGPLVVSALSRVEVPGAFWRKHRRGEMAAADARLLSDAFAEDLRSRFAATAASGAILGHAGALVAVHPLRAYDAVQLASALAARKADPACTDFACFDGALRDAAAAEGLTPVP